nr:hypothetical protein [Actinomycetota bacterium]
MRGVRKWRGLAVLVAVIIPAACTPLPWPGRSPVPASGERRTLVTNECHGIALLTGCSRVQFTWLKGYDDPATPNNLDRVGVLEIGPRSARNVLVLNPGTSAGSAYFLPLAQDIVRRTRGRWQVWSVERRENQLEDQSVLDKAKQGKSTPQKLFDYYLGWLTDPTVTNHFKTIPDSSVAFARGWGMNV